MARTHRRRPLVLLVLAALLLTAVGVTALRRSPASTPAGCVVSAAEGSFALNLTQAANAATIASVGRRLGLPDHAITVALATALQESKLRNLPYGDRDSLGLFQQRPSQGWGTRTQLLDPHYAAGAFYTHLRKVPRWQSLPVAEAAQAVQRSADGTAYAAWEPASRLMARAFTGELPRAMACSFDVPTSTSRGLLAAIAGEPGTATIGQPVSRRAGWATASWLVAQSAQYGIARVAFDGYVWDHTRQVWTPTPAAGATVTYRLLSRA